MDKTSRLAALLLVATPFLAGAASAAGGTITDEEEHFLRGFFDRQSGAAALDRVALERGSADIRTYAQRELDLYRSLADGITKLYDEFKLNTRPLQPGETSPKLSQGVSRGVDPLPEGWALASRNVAGFLNGGGMPGGAPGGVGGAGGRRAGGPGAAPGGAGSAGGPAAAGGTPGGARAGGNPMMARYDYDLAAMKQLSGTEFDKQYALRVAIAHNAMIRHLSSELTTEGNHPDMVAFAKSALKQIVAQNSALENLAAGKGLPAPRGGGPGEPAAGTAPDGAGPRPGS